MWNGKIKSGICAGIFSVSLFASLGLFGCGGAGGGDGQPALLGPVVGTSRTTTTSDSAPPTVSATSPANAASDVGTTSSVSATFSKAMTNPTLNTTSFTLVTTTSGAASSGTVTVSGNTATFTPSAALAASTQYTATIAAGVADAAGNPLAADFTWSFTTAAAPASGANFTTRCAQPGVIKCVGFDSAADISGNYQSNSGIVPPYTMFPGATPPALDTSVKASGASSLKFTIPSNSPADTSGSYFTNFSSDLLTQFGANSEFYVQWRQRFSPEFLNTIYQGAGGWKQVIIGTGDKPGGPFYASCTALETVLVNSYGRGFPHMYNSCTGSTSHGPYYGFEEPFGTYDFKLQNARPSPYCLYSQSTTGYFPPNGNCFGYVANEWMTFQVKIKTGSRANDEWQNSVVTLSVARENQASQPVFNFPINLTAGIPAEDQKFGKIFLLPYNTGKNPAQVHPTAYTWYDELIISRTPIADPAP